MHDDNVPEVNGRDVGDEKTHHDVLQHVNAPEQEVVEEVTCGRLGAEQRHKLQTGALQHAQHQVEEQRLDRVDGGGVVAAAVVVAVDERIVEELLVGEDSLGDEGENGDLIVSGGEGRDEESDGVDEEVPGVEERGAGEECEEAVATEEEEEPPPTRSASRIAEWT